MKTYSCPGEGRDWASRPTAVEFIPTLLSYPVKISPNGKLEEGCYMLANLTKLKIARRSLSITHLALLASSFPRETLAA